MFGNTADYPVNFSQMSRNYVSPMIRERTFVATKNSLFVLPVFVGRFVMYRKKDFWAEIAFEGFFDPGLGFVGLDFDQFRAFEFQKRGPDDGFQFMMIDDVSLYSGRISSGIFATFTLKLNRFRLRNIGRDINGF